MGWLDWLAKTEEIPASQLEQWLATKAEEQDQSNHEKISEHEKTMKQAEERIRNALSVLQNAKLKNPNIPEQQKHFMEGNRAEFAKKINAGLRQGNFEDVADRMERQVTILREFFRDEVNAVIQTVREYEEGRQRLKLVLQKNPYERALHALRNYQEAKERRAMVLQEMKKLKERILLLEHELSVKQKRLEQSYNDAHYKASVDRATKLEEGATRLHHEISELFSPLKELLKKYAHASFHHKQVVEQYLQDAPVALSTDIQLVIIDALAKAKSMVEKEEITFKNETKKNKILNALSLVTKEELSILVREYALISKQAKEARQFVNEHPILDLRAKLQAEVDHAKRKIKQRNIEYERLSRQENMVPYPSDVLAKLKIKVV